MTFIQAPDEEFEEYLRHLISEQCTGDRNEVSSGLRIKVFIDLCIFRQDKLKVYSVRIISVYMWGQLHAYDLRNIQK